MKKIILLIGILAIAYNVLFAGVPPKTVQKAFDKKFSHAKNVTWNNKPTTGWEALFTQKGYMVYVNFTEDGSWLVTQKEIKISSLPNMVADAIKTNYSGWGITKTLKNESTKIGIIYEITLSKGVETIAVSFNEDGTTINE